jgi:hypothetical protein
MRERQSRQEQCHREAAQYDSGNDTLRAMAQAEPLRLQRDAEEAELQHGSAADPAYPAEQKAHDRGDADRGQWLLPNRAAQGVGPVPHGVSGIARRRLRPVGGITHRRVDLVAHQTFDLIAQPADLRHRVVGVIREVLDLRHDWISMVVTSNRDVGAPIIDLPSSLP